MSLRILLCLVMLPLLAGCQNNAETTLSGSIQGTTYQLKMVTRGLPVTAEELKTDVEAIFRLVDEQLSNWREDSAISRFNQQKTTDWQPVPAAIIQLVSVAREIHDRTGGCYDLTVKPLFELWGFSRHEQSVPDDQAIRGVLAHVGMDKLEIDAQGNRLRKKDPELQVSLDSIAQGYTVAVIAQLLEDRGILNYLAEVGGEMKVRGVKADGTPWRVAIEKPTPMAREVQRILDLQEANGVAVMTSGTYRNFFEAGGQSYSHILDPRTGRPVTHALLSATVLDENPTLADAWSTALLCVGETEGARIAEGEGLKALLIYREGDQLKEHMSNRFLVAPTPAAPAAQVAPSPQADPAPPAAPAP
jgi:thiamine biosynthesis lipoprotein